jgi:phosphate/sulfate permease
MAGEVRQEDRKTHEWILQIAITLFLGFSLWLLIHNWLGMPSAEAFLVVGLVAAWRLRWGAGDAGRSALCWWMFQSKHIMASVGPQQE